MRNPLVRIKELIPNLPGKDSQLANKFLENRDFKSILEIVESDIYKANKAKYIQQEEVPNDYISLLTELKSELLIYISYIEVPNNSKDYNDYY